jgi:ATP-dependent DNA helicase RecG
MVSLPTTYLPSPTPAELQTLRSYLVQLCTSSAMMVEGEDLEIKGWCANEKQLAKEVSEATVCLANAMGGIVLVGVDDDEPGTAKFSKCNYNNVREDWITQRIHDQTVPFLT